MCSLSFLKDDPVVFILSPPTGNNWVFMTTTAVKSAFTRPAGGFVLVYK